MQVNPIDMGYHRLAVAILLAAVQDLHSEDVIARVDAWRFLRGTEGHTLADYVDIAPEKYERFIVAERQKIRSVGV